MPLKGRVCNFSKSAVSKVYTLWQRGDFSIGFLTNVQTFLKPCSLCRYGLLDVVSLNKQERSLNPHQSILTWMTASVLSFMFSHSHQFLCLFPAFMHITTVIVYWAQCAFTVSDASSVMILCGKVLFGPVCIM